MTIMLQILDVWKYENPHAYIINKHAPCISTFMTEIDRESKIKQTRPEVNLSDLKNIWTVKYLISNSLTTPPKS